MSMKRLVTWIALLAVFAMAMRFSLDSDTWWHLRAGAWIVDQGRIPQADPFSYTRFGADWRYPGWLVEVPMFWLYDRFGPGALNLWTAALVTLAFFFVWRTLSGGVFLRAFILILAAAASGIYWAARPYLVTFVLAAVFLWILEANRWRDPDTPPLRRLFWLPALMIVWVNSHGGFIVGFILLGIYILAELVRRFFPISKFEIPNSKSSFRNAAFLFWILLLSLLAACLNPSGPAMLLYPFKTVSIAALSGYIQEWQPPDFHAAQVQPFIWLILLALGALGLSRRRIALTDFLLLSVFLYLAFDAARNVALFALVAPTVIARHLAAPAAALSRRLGLGMAPTRESRPRRTANLLIFTVLALTVLVKTLTVLPAQAALTEIRTSMPVEAVNFIKSTRPPGRLFNTYNWGGYLLWELPEYPVFIDGRTDLYDDALVSEWLQVVQAAAGWQEILDRWEVRLVLVEPGQPLVSQLAAAGWVRLYADELAVVYGR